jgi:hypothetical protein
MSVAPIPVVTDFSYTELKERVEVLSRRVNSLTAMEVSLIDIDQTPSINITEDNSLLKLPDLSQIDCEELAEDLIACDEALVIAQAEIADLKEELEEACSGRPPDGSWIANRGVFSNVPSGSCSQFIYYGQQYNAATLSQSLSFLGGSLGNGYKIINTLGTITALYQVRKSDGQVFPPNPVNSDGTFPCMFLQGSIQIKKYNPSTGLYGSSQTGISTGSSGIGEYGVFHKTNYAWSDTPPDNPYQIGTIIKETAADEFVFTKENDPCA